MDATRASLSAEQQLVEDLRREVAIREAELGKLLARKNLLMQNFSIPIFPPEYIPSPPLDVNLRTELQRGQSAKAPRAAPDESDHAEYYPRSTAADGTAAEDTAVRQEGTKVRAVPRDVSKVRTVPRDVSKVRTVPRDVSKVRTVPLDVSKVRTVPLDVSKVRTVPQEGAKVRTVPQEGAKVRTVPQEGAKVRTVPQEGAKVRTVPREGAKVGTVPREGAKVRTVPREGAKVPARPEEGAKVAALPDEGVKVPAFPEEGTKVPSFPEEGAKVPAFPEEGAKVPVFPKEGTKVPAFPKEGTKVPAFPKEGTKVPAFAKEKVKVMAVPKEGSRVPAVRMEWSKVPAVRMEGSKVPAVRIEGSKGPAVPMEGANGPAVPMEAANSPAVRMEVADGPAVPKERAKVRAIPKVRGVPKEGLTVPPLPYAEFRTVPTEEKNVRTIDHSCHIQNRKSSFDSSSSDSEDVSAERHDISGERHDISGQRHDNSGERHVISGERHDTSGQRQHVSVDSKENSGEIEDNCSESEDESSESEDESSESEDKSSESEDKSSESEDESSESDEKFRKSEDTSSESEDTSSETKDTSNEIEEVVCEVEQISCEVKEISKDITSREPPRKVDRSTTAMSAAPGVFFPKPVRAPCVPDDAPAEDFFDWELLRLPGPWVPGSSAGLPAESACPQIPKSECSLPRNFESIEKYQSSFKNLIIEESNAYLHSCWELLKNAETILNDAETPGNPSAIRQEVLIEYGTMYPSALDPFLYCELFHIKGLPRARFDLSEVLILVHGNFSCVAIVYMIDRGSVLLRTLATFTSNGGQCTLLRLANVVTMRRQYMSLLNVGAISRSLQQQLLDPQLLEQRCCPISPPADDCLDEDVELSFRSDIIAAWKQKQKFNKRQLVTIEAVIELRRGFLLVQGPPGTGKTSTIVGMISALRISEPATRVLVCSSSNAAIDEIVCRLMSHMLDKAGNSYVPKAGSLLRSGVGASVHRACLRVFVDNICLRLMGSQSAIVKKQVLDSASTVCCTISGSGNPIFSEIRKFDVVIIDEAAQAFESEVLIALQRVRERCVMVGDPCQLPGVALQRPGLAYKRSLFERMQESGRPVFLMTTQYRMHSDISKFPSARFYQGRMKDSLQSQSMQPIFKDIALKTGYTNEYRFNVGAYVFLDVGWGAEQGEIGGHSLSNVDEAEVVTSVVHVIAKSIKESMNVNIGVITPYLAQRSVIMENLRHLGLDERACEVNTVDGFQGQEKDVIILSCVRAQTDYGLGFVSDERRLNVALTRAKHSLIIVGHAETLRSRSPVWNALIEDVKSRGLYQGLRRRRKSGKFKSNSAALGSAPGPDVIQQIPKNGARQLEFPPEERQGKKRLGKERTVMVSTAFGQMPREVKYMNGVPACHTTFENGTESARALRGNPNFDKGLERAAMDTENHSVGDCCRRKGGPRKWRAECRSACHDENIASKRVRLATEEQGLQQSRADPRE